MYKECPFCGDKNAICEPYRDKSYVRCQSCHAEGPTGNFKEAGELWNKRADNDIYQDLKEYCDKIVSDRLSKDQAIQRIRDIRECKETDHIYSFDLSDSHLLSSPALGAINELMAIFDIKESEL